MAIVFEDGKRYYFLGGHYRAFVNWCQENNVSIYNRKYVYVHSFQTLMGIDYDNAVFIWHETWIERNLRERLAIHDRVLWIEALQRSNKKADQDSEGGESQPASS